MTARHDGVRFLNVDLEVRGRDELKWLVTEFGEDVVNLYCGEAQGHFLATFECDQVRGDPDSVVGYFCHLVDNLSTDARRSWDDLLSRVFNIGFDGGIGPSAYESELRPETIAAVARIGASLQITIYPAPVRTEEPSQ